jgi:flavodoxin
MRALVAYMSKTGNTRKVAEAIYEALDCEKDIMPVDQVVDIGGHDLSFLGFPMQRFGPDPKTASFLQKQCQPGTDVALFVTHASPEDAAELPGWLEGFRNAAAGATVLGIFNCQGQIAGWIKFIMSIAPSREIRAMARQDNGQGQPDAARLDRARQFAREMLESKKGQASRW